VPFANEIILTLPNGDVAVGAAAFEAKFRASWTVSGHWRGSAYTASHEFSLQATPHRRVQLRLLESPESLAAGTLCVDVVVAAMTDAGEAAQVSKSTRNLVVLKRNAEGRVANMTEEEGHRRVRAMYAQRCASLTLAPRQRRRSPPALPPPRTSTRTRRQTTWSRRAHRS
jgi:hypothetical protein